MRMRGLLDQGLISIAQYQQAQAQAQQQYLHQQHQDQQGGFQELSDEPLDENAVGEVRTGFIGLVTNSPLWIAVMCFSVAQLLKFAISWWETRQFQYERLVGSGGMPSAHSAFVMGLCTSVGIRDGSGSSTFAIAFVFACIVMYDAVGLRQHCGKQAVCLNAVLADLPSDHPHAPATYGKLREQLGHTLAQVAAGGTLGFLLALIVQGALGSSLK